MKMIKLLVVFVMLSGLIGCGYETVPQGHKGKILDRQGFQPDIYPPKRVNVGWYGHLVNVETTTFTYNEPITVRMKDNMDLKAALRFQLRMGDKDVSLNRVFNDIKPTNDVISLKEVYDVYGKIIVNRVSREVLSRYKIGDVQENFKEISDLIYAQIKAEFKPTPLVISDVALGKLDYPPVIDNAILAAAERNLAIAKEEADVLVKLTKIAGMEKVAAGQYRIKMQEAKRIRDSNKIISSGISDKLLELRRLEVQEAMVGAIGNGDTTTIFIPYGSQNQIGMQSRMYSGK